MTRGGRTRGSPASDAPRRFGAFSFSYFPSIFGAVSLSQLGDVAMYLVLAIWAVNLTHTASAGGLVFLALSAPYAIAPVFGVLADRVSRRNLLVCTDLSMAVFILVLLTVHGRNQLWVLYTVAFVYGVAGAIYSAARSGLLHERFPLNALGDINATLRSTQEGIRLVAPAGAAILYSLAGPSPVIAIDSFTFLGSALLLSHLDPEPRSFREVRDIRLWRRQLTEGFRYITRVRALRVSVGAFSLAFLAIGMSETLIFVVIRKGLGEPTSFVGYLNALQGAGAIVGGVLAYIGLRRIREATVMTMGLVGVGLGFVLWSVATLAAVMAGMVIIGIGLTASAIALHTLMQRATPGHLQGQIAAAADAAITTPQTLSIALGASLVTFVSFRVLLLAMAITFGISGIATLRSHQESEAASGRDEQGETIGDALSNPELFTDSDVDQTANRGTNRVGARRENGLQPQALK